MPLFRARVTPVEAVQWTGLNVHHVAKVCASLLAKNAANKANPWIWYTGRSRIKPEGNTVSIRTVDGLKVVRAGDWIIRDIFGLYDVLTPDEFVSRYEPCE